jgi:NAD(P)-dependent dehydrogenase (short-subunit alcohol dehydrogenase family)
MKNILILGGYGQIGNAIYQKLRFSHKVFRTNTRMLKLGNENDYLNLTKLINKTEPSLIINCVGIFDGNEGDLQNILNVNLRPTWYIIKILNGLAPDVKIDYSVLGSSAYRIGKKNYYLYSSSKAALSNLIQGASLAAEDHDLRLNVINLPPVQSEMRTSADISASDRGCISLSEAADFVLDASLYRFTSGIIDYFGEKVSS